MQYDTVRRSAMQYNIGRRSTIQHNTARRGSTALYSRIQSDGGQRCAIQPETAECYLRYKTAPR
eukprot:6775059-Lingulodinium_polyedra.AAC.1